MGRWLDSNQLSERWAGRRSQLPGGLLGAAVLIMVNAVWVRLINRRPRLTMLFEGTPTVLVQDGKVTASLARVLARYSRRIVLLTVFRKTRMHEDREIDRARRAFRRCVREAHTVDAYDGSESDDRTDRVAAVVRPADGRAGSRRCL